MRSVLSALTIVALLASPAFALPGDGHGNGGDGPAPKYGYVTVENQSNSAVRASVNGGTAVLLDTGDSFQATVLVSGKTEATVAAHVDGAPANSATATGTAQHGKVTVATISDSGSAIAISMSKPGHLAGLVTRDTGVALASAGGLLPLLWLGALLGGKPRRSKPRMTA